MATNSTKNATYGGELPRNATLIVAGHLRGVCTVPGQDIFLRQRVELCQRMMLLCRVVLVSYSTLQGSARGNVAMVARQGSSRDCIANLSASLRFAAVTISNVTDQKIAEDEGVALWPQTSTRLASYRSMVRSLVVGSQYAHDGDVVIRIRPDGEKFAGRSSTAGGGIRKEKHWKAMWSLRDQTLHRCTSGQAAGWPRYGIVNSDSCFLAEAATFKRFVAYWHDHLEQLAADTRTHGHPEWSMEVVAEHTNISFPGTCFASRCQYG